MPKAYGYARVSSARQRDEGVSLEDQKGRLPKIAAQKFPDHEYAGTYWDSQSASCLPFGQRRNGRIVSDALEHGDALIVVKGDRIFRSLHDHVTSDRLFAKLGVTLYLAKQDMMLGAVEKDASSRLFANMLAVFAEYESELISSRVTDAIEYMGQNGIWPHGGTPLGWMIGKDRRLYPDMRVRAATQRLKDIQVLNCLNSYELLTWCRREKFNLYTDKRIEWTHIYSLFTARRRGWPAGKKTNKSRWVMGPDGYALPPNHPCFIDESPVKPIPIEIE